MNYNSNNVNNPFVFQASGSAKFKKVLQEKCISIAGLSKKMGFSRNYLGEILAGRKALTDSVRLKLNDILGTDIQD